MPGNSPIRYANYTRQSKLGLVIWLVIWGVG